MAKAKAAEAGHNVDMDYPADNPVDGYPYLPIAALCAIAWLAFFGAACAFYLAVEALG